MDITEICGRETGSSVSVSEMEFVVEQYIKEKKEVSVTVNTFRDYGNKFSMIDRMSVMKDMELLNRAFDKSAEYFLNKPRI